MRPTQLAHQTPNRFATRVIPLYSHPVSDARLWWPVFRCRSVAGFEVSTEEIRPKHAWTSGVVRLVANPAHGIKGGRPKPFNSLLDLGAVIEQALVDEGIRLHISRRMRKFISAPDDRASRKPKI